ncbi:hypothetical protein NliqN6_1884 [Naganishia liquefaciens]|uniref:Small ribosomal subunit protein bS18m n=1 Tax=Naganishia liquefaciens TaxID=104408 RepID=A0A8H3YEQ4_9TREE|nr:hypothetical protein NliqN6_1884 [Naganishia liquefaciens]
MSFLASTSRSLFRALTFSSASSSRHLSASACTFEKITRPSGSGPAPYSQQDGDATRDVLAQLAKGLKETGPSASEGFSSGSHVNLPARSVPSTPIQTFRNGQVRRARSATGTHRVYTNIPPSPPLNQLYSPIDLHKSSLFPKARRGAKPPLLGPSAPLAKRSDPFYILDVNPIDESTNHKLVSAYVTQMGKIKTRAETGLTWKNQRRVGKMVRRARAMGLISRWDNNLTRDYTP